MGVNAKVLVLLAVLTCASSDRTAASRVSLSDELIKKLGTATVDTPSALSATSGGSDLTSRSPRQYGRRLTPFQTQMRLRGPPPARGPEYTHGQSVVSVTGVNRGGGAPAPAPPPGSRGGAPAPPPGSRGGAPAPPPGSRGGAPAPPPGVVGAPAPPPPLQQPVPVSQPIGPPSGFQQQTTFGTPLFSAPSPPDIGSPAPPPSPPPVTVAPPIPPPPVAPATTAPPSPPPPTGQGSVEATNIRCLQSSSRESLTATLISLQPFVNPPVITSRPAINPLTSRVCSLTSESGDSRRLSLAVTNLGSCGVEECVQPSGERWLCLTLRFPLIAGIHLPEDDVIQIQCRPQDPTQTSGKQLTVQATGFEQLSPVLFSGGRQVFECEVALFRRTPGSNMFSTVVTGADVITLGEEIHLRSIVKDGDGWMFSKLSDVLVERVAADGSSLPSDKAALVFSDGCRNDAFTILAPQHPERHQVNSLISNFAFRVFTFQGMTSGDRLQVSARVTGCVEAIDCVPTACADGGQGFGRRRRRREAGILANNTTHWSRNLAFSVVIPETPRGFAAVAAEDQTPVPTPSGCPVFLLGSLVAALASCLLLLGCAVFVLSIHRRRHLKSPQGKTLPSAGFLQVAPSIHGREKLEFAGPPLGGDSGGVPQHQCGASTIGGARCGGCLATWSGRGAERAHVTAPRGRCTARQLKRRRADVRRSFSAGNLRCSCSAPEEDDSISSKVNVSIVRIPAHENIYSEPTAKWDVAPVEV